MPTDKCPKCTEFHIADREVEDQFMVCEDCELKHCERNRKLEVFPKLLVAAKHALILADYIDTKDRKETDWIFNDLRTAVEEAMRAATEVK